MKKTVYECDRCKVSMNKPFMTLKVKYSNTDYISRTHHFCKKCIDDIVMFKIYPEKRVNDEKDRN